MSNPYIKIFTTTIIMYAIAILYYFICGYHYFDEINLTAVVCFIVEAIFFILYKLNKFDIMVFYKDNQEKILKFLPVVITVIMAFYSIILFDNFKTNHLGGDINLHMFTSKRFGIPQELANRGIEATYLLEGSGWDGQFYFFIANDVLGKKDTIKHLDVPPYRYTRVGFGLLTNVLSKLALQSWVSPTFYLTVYFILYLCAVYAFSKLFIKLNKPVWLSLLWIFFMGNFLTMFNALPDCASDSFFAISILFLYLYMNSEKHRLINGICFIFFAAFAALTREVYNLYLFSFFIFAIIESIKNKKIKYDLFILSCIPVLCYLGQRTYAALHIGKFTADGICSIPLVETFKYLFGDLATNHLLIPLFLVVLAISFYTAIKRLKDTNVPFIRMAALALIFISSLYLCFGHVVMEYYAGYWKVLGSNFILLAIIINHKDKIEKIMLYVLFFITIITNVFYYNNRVGTFCLTDKYRAKMNYNKEIKSKTTPKECFENYNYEAKIKNWEHIKIGHRNLIAINASVKNNTPYTWESTSAKGGVEIIAIWRLDNGKVVKTSFPTYVYPDLKAGEERDFYILSRLPKKKYLKKDDLKIIITPNQLQCTVMYEKNSLEAEEIKYKDTLTKGQ